MNVDSTIKADQKAFLQQTGTRPQDAIMPTTGMSADAMMSPAAGKFGRLVRRSQILIHCHRHSQAGDNHGRGDSAYLP